MSDTTRTPTTDGSEIGSARLERPVTRRWRLRYRAPRVRRRPDLYTAYSQDMAILDTPTKRWSVVLLVLVAVGAVLVLSPAMLTMLSVAFPVAIGAIGLNLLTGYAGQVSLGHAFFIGVGAYAGAAVGGVSTDPQLIALGITEVPVWLMTAGLVAALIGAAVGFLGLRFRGLYLAVATLAVVFLGQHLFREWSSLTGGAGLGRQAARASMFGFSFTETGPVFGVTLSGVQRTYLLTLTLLVVFALIAKNLARSDTGRAFAAVRDRDVAASVIGVDVTKTKILAFVISSFYAGVAGALYASVLGYIEPASFGLMMSVLYLAMILVGGIGTISGAIIGALFIQFLGRISRDLVGFIHDIPGIGGLSPELVEAVLPGLLLIGFLLFEPRGLFGIWIRIRNYWKGWPFTY